MEDSLKKFLEFNGKKIYFKSEDGNWWIAIKPICEALGVHYKAQHSAVLRNKKLGRLSCLKRIVGADGRLREMLCLPEFYIYGWIFKLQSNSPELEEYQWKCYELLYNYFHGSITETETFLKQKTIAESKLEAATKEMYETEAGKKCIELQKLIADSKKGISKQHKLIVNSQIELWLEEEGMTSVAKTDVGG